VIVLGEEIGLVQSMGATGSCFDHDSAESFWSILKHGYCYRHTFTDLTQLKAGIGNYIHFYNHERKYSKIWKVSPKQHELASTTATLAA
jgi:putative transposase